MNPDPVNDLDSLRTSIPLAQPADVASRPGPPAGDVVHVLFGAPGPRMGNVAPVANQDAWSLVRGRREADLPQVGAEISLQKSRAVREVSQGDAGGSHPPGAQPPS